MFNFGFEIEIKLGRLPTTQNERRALYRDVDRILRVLPPSWDWILVSGEMLEVRTAGAKVSSQFYRDTGESWDHLVTHLERLQRASLRGISNVHLHVSLASDPDPLSGSNSERRRVGRRLARLAKVYETLWRVACGLGFTRPRESRGIELFSWKALHSGEESFDHSRVFNLSPRYPTMEVKSLGGLVGRHGILSLESLREDVAWVFALLARVTERGGRCPSLAELGLPLLAGAVPSPQRMDTIMDVCFPGRTDIHRSLSARRESAVRQGTWRRSLYRAPEAPFARLGLREIFIAHRRRGGHDMNIVDTLSRPQTLYALARDVRSAAGAHRSPLLDILPDLLPPEICSLVRRQVE